MQHLSTTTAERNVWSLAAVRRSTTLQYRSSRLVRSKFIVNVVQATGYLSRQAEPIEIMCRVLTRVEGKNHD